MTRGLGVYFPDQQSNSEVHHQALELKEYHTNWRPDLDTLLSALPILNRGEHVVSNKIMEHFIESAKSYS
jgi:hypothetical protein